MEGVIGFTTLFAGNFAPRAWALCQGQTINIASNTALFSILGTTYGGDGRVTFALPNLAGRAVVGAGQGPGLSTYYLGQNGGSETATMNSNQMPAHVHPVSVVASNPTNGAGIADNTSPLNNVYAPEINGVIPYSSSANLAMGAIQGTLQTGAIGGSQPFGTLRPMLGLNYIICLQGVFPVRN